MSRAHVRELVAEVELPSSARLLCDWTGIDELDPCTKASSWTVTWKEFGDQQYAQNVCAEHRRALKAWLTEGETDEKEHDEQLEDPGRLPGEPRGE